MINFRFIFITVLFFIFSGSSFASSPLVSADWLSKRLDDENIKILDIRNKIDNGGLEVFLKGHIPGSIHSDYIKDGWRVKKNNIVGLLPSESQYKNIIGLISQENLGENKCLYCKPGIRLDKTSDGFDQNYTGVTPGIDYYIVGRGITESKKPLEAAKYYKYKLYNN